MRTSNSFCRLTYVTPRCCKPTPEDRRGVVDSRQPEVTEAHCRGVQSWTAAYLKWSGRGIRGGFSLCMLFARMFPYTGDSGDVGLLRDRLEGALQSPLFEFGS